MSVKELMRKIADFETEPSVFKVMLEAHDYNHRYCAYVTYRCHHGGKPTPHIEAFGRTPKAALRKVYQKLEEEGQRRARSVATD